MKFIFLILFTIFSSLSLGADFIVDESIVIEDPSDEASFVKMDFNGKFESDLFSFFTNSLERVRIQNNGDVEVEENFIIKHSSNSDLDVIFDADNGFGGFGISKVGASGFMNFMPNSNTAQIIFASPIAGLGVNTTFLDSDNEGEMRINTLPGAGRNGEVIITHGAPLRPNENGTSDLGSSSFNWGKLFIESINISGSATGVLRVDASDDVFSSAENDAFNKSFGITAGTVAEGDHGHTKSQITDFTESDYVHTTGAETVAGVKTFSDTIQSITTVGADNLLLEKSNSSSHWLINAGRVAFFDNWLLFKNENEVGNYTFAVKNTGQMIGKDGSAGAPTFSFDNASNYGMSYTATGNEGLVFSSEGFARLRIEDDGTLSTLGTPNYETLVTDPDDIPNLQAVKNLSIGDFSDVDTAIKTAEDGDWLRYNGTSSKWERTSFPRFKQNAIAVGTIGSASNAANQSFTIDLTGFNYIIGDTIRIGLYHIRGDLSSDGTEYIDVGINSTGATKSRHGETGYSDVSILRTSGNAIDETYTIKDIGAGVAGLEIFVSPASAVNFSPSGMPNSWWWQLKIDVLQL